MLIGHPVTKGFEVMVEKEELYPNLRTASINLIPYQQTHQYTSHQLQQKNKNNEVFYLMRHYVC